MKQQQPEKAFKPVALAVRCQALAAATGRKVLKLWNNGILVQAVGIPIRHALAFWGLVRCFRGLVSWRTGALAVLMWLFSGLGVTAGVHRLWTHQSYKASPLMETLLMIMFSCADQGGIIGWSLTHAMHHTRSDLPGDPHNRAEGFWTSHFGWLYSTDQNRISHYDYHKVMNGLGPIVHFHDYVCVLWDPLWSMAFPGMIASLWGEFWSGFFVAGALRWFCVQHITFFVNSVAHGERVPGGTEYAFDRGAHGIGPQVSFLVAFLALGEGWHDYHHLFPWDYAAAELGAWDQFNPTKVLLDTCAKLGIVTGRRRCSDRLQLLRRQQIMDQTAADMNLSEDQWDRYEAKGIAGPLFFRHRVMALVTSDQVTTKS